MKAAKIIITLYFNEDLVEDEVQSVLAEMEYNIDHQWIEETKISGLIDA